LQVIDMASKLPADMPLKWKQTVLLQAAESAANVFRLQHPQQQQQQQQYGNAAELAAQHLASPPAAGSKTATPAPDGALGAALTEQQRVQGNAGAAQPLSSMQQVLAGQDGDVLPGLLAAAQSHPQLRSMAPEKREALLKQLLQQHQARRARAYEGQMGPGMQQQGLMQANALHDSGRAGSMGAGGFAWNSFSQQQQPQQQHGIVSGAMVSAGVSPGLGGVGADVFGWMHGMSDPSRLPGRQQQSQGARGAQTPHSASLGGYGAFSGLEQQHSGLANDPAFNAALGTASSRLDVFQGAGAGNSGSNWDGGNIFAGLMGGIGPEMRQQYMKKLQRQLELHGLNKKQLVENIKAKGALAALKAIGMVPSDLGSTPDAQTGAGSGGAASASAAAGAAGMDPAMAAAMPSDAAFAAMRQQHLQQQLHLGPQQQAWLQHHQQAAAAGGMGGGMSDGLNALLTQQQQWQGMMGMQPAMQGGGGYTSLMGPSLYGLEGMLGGERVMGSGAGAAAGAGGLAGLAGMGDPMTGLMGGPQQAMLMQQQQQQHGMAFCSAMASPYQQPHVSMGMVAAQQQLIYQQQQQQLAGFQMGQQGSMGSAAAAAAGPWGAMGMGMQQVMQGIGSSAALDPPVLELPNLSPIKTTSVMGQQAPFAAAAGISALSASAAAAAVAAAGVGGTAAGAVPSSGLGGSQGRMQGRGQQHLQPLELPGSFTEVGGVEDEAIAMSPFGQLGLNAADVDALLSGFDPSGMGLLGHGDGGAGGGNNG
jgi:hypothetical protein